MAGDLIAGPEERKRGLALHPSDRKAAMREQARRSKAMSVMRVRRRMLGFLAILPIALPAAVAPAQEPYPSRPVEVVVPFTAGGGSDLLARLLCDGLSKRLGQSFVVLNRPGANSNVGIHSVVKSRPDGHTLIMASLGLAANPSLCRKLPFDPLSDLAPITLIANSPTILVVAPPVAAG